MELSFGIVVVVELIGVVLEQLYIVIVKVQGVVLAKLNIVELIKGVVLEQLNIVKFIGVVPWHYCAKSRDYLWQNRVAILSRKP